MTKGRQHIIGIIPARYGSTRLPAKPLIDLCGKPMIQHVYERASQSTLLTSMLVATDDKRIVDVVQSFGGEAVMTPASLRSGTDRIAFVAKELPDADIVVNVQGDEPLLAPEMIDQAVRPLVADKAIRVGTLVKKITSAEEIKNPSVVKVVLDINGNGIYFSRSPIPHMRDVENIDRWHQQFIYYKHIGLYVFRKDFLLEYASWQESSLEQIEKLEQLRILEHGYSIHTAVTEYDSIPVDTADDAERVRRILQTTIVSIA
jgi:3-deoxy-manno-octulosonate cytidylyltransferase (CMP-KDO synthetase)